MRWEGKGGGSLEVALYQSGVDPALGLGQVLRDGGLPRLVLRPLGQLVQPGLQTATSAFVTFQHSMTATP